MILGNKSSSCKLQWKIVGREFLNTKMIKGNLLLFEGGKQENQFVKFKQTFKLILWFLFYELDNIAFELCS